MFVILAVFNGIRSGRVDRTQYVILSVGNGEAAESLSQLPYMEVDTFAGAEAVVAP